MAGDGVHHDAEGEDVGTHDEDDEEELAEAEDLAAQAAKEDCPGVGHGVDMWVAQFELADYVASVGGEGAEGEEEDEARNEAEGGECGGEGEDTERDGFGDHDHAGLPGNKSISLMKM